MIEEVNKDTLRSPQFLQAKDVSFCHDCNTTDLEPVHSFYVLNITITV